MSTHSHFTSLPLRAALALVSATTAVFFAGVYAAHAWPGRSGEARSTFTVAGSLTLPAGATRPPMLRFVFHKTGASDCALDTRADMGPTGDQFTAQIDYDACGRAFFDGSDVTADVLVNGAAVITGQPVNPVPYAHFASSAGVARQYETPDCPSGYARDATVTRWVVCQRRRATGAVFDEVVRVGTGNSAFWIDRYEASIWTDAEASSGSRGRPNIPWGAESRDFPEGFPDNGQWSNPPRGLSQRLYAASRSGVIPTRAPTWFQAQEACRSSSKRLPSREEWLAAAQGTDDPGASNGDGGRCMTATSAPREAGGGTSCESNWGAQDMIGNFSEWTDEWYASPSISASGDNRNTQWPPADFRRDRTWSIDSRAITTYPTSGYVQGLPAAAQRGGDYGSLEAAGVFAMLLNYAPSTADAATGFRCVIPR